MAELPFASLMRSRKPGKARQRGDAPSAAPVAGPQPDLFAAPLPGIAHALTYLDTVAIGLTRVDVRHLRAGEGADAYLYHVTTQADLETIQARGTIVFSPRAPLVLTERPGVPPWLANMMEIMESDDPAGHTADMPVVLRVKRFVIDELLEHDPDRTRRYGVSFFLLTGIARSE
ncbi:hypothetical protein Gain_0012_039 [Komagataeibacter intermedius TF2]|uniref:Uncharacterized protein n=3 Tax=Komagataeibacter intermedius TaxID=66229 RepID=A0A0N0MGE4_9PROT|nr:hypothetical protein [Komagataeibacter intermedius]KPH88663.1 hypothetical protein GLUCOINTEAF2_0201425 [Komagataeibacter intermedius AF2]GAN85976.1 hypothetical protein Gain_0012_039 [Komagataeibacter intermedius TF2]GBQ72412.1 hypothetical protein AA0521_2102 [Komagataeibacter intermedius NRIC 0521]